ncbi:Endopeptidase S2P [Heracleum sosnowskyi]|uniref:Endopeptidase S2P n=1 Tax=Heracleum sosnowskyi TaxID=360622 RepID=A0AAD8MDA2_9APIA|nr:Endopeptidase S2P [Heracleum sosnowskyi]
MRMEGRRFRRFSRSNHNQTVLPLRVRHLSNTVSCWYCDFKSSALNDPLFHFGRRYSRYLRVWFSVGTGFSLATLFGVTLVLLWELAQFLNLFGSDYETISLLSDFLFGYSPSVLSLADTGYICISTVISVAAHELGHALSATSEGIQIEYIAVFLAVLFPGALVAFNHEVLQALPRVAALRIYCAGIWHNAVICAACALAMFLLPLVLHPIYIRGEIPMVLDVSSESPLFKYISPGDFIVSLDGIRIHGVDEWIEITTMLHQQTNQNLKDKEYIKVDNRRKGYCVPRSLIQESYHIHSDARSSCPDELSSFVTMPCLPLSTSNDPSSDDNIEKRTDHIHCLNAKDIVELKKCGDGWMESASNGSSCSCLEESSCLAPIQMPGLTWTEIKYARPVSLKCLQLMRESLSSVNSSKFDELGCGGTFVFIGDVFSMAHSVRLTSYQPRWSIPFGAHLPDVLEKLLKFTFHVSLMLALLNSLPVYFLDGESILEGFLPFFRLISPRKRETLLRSLLLGGMLVARNNEGEVIFCATRRVQAFWPPEMAECKALVMAWRLGQKVRLCRHHY